MTTIDNNKYKSLKSKIFILEKVLLESRLKMPLSHHEIDKRKIKMIKINIQKLKTGKDVNFDFKDIRNFYKPKAQNQTQGYGDGELVGEKVTSGIDNQTIINESGDFSGEHIMQNETDNQDVKNVLKNNINNTKNTTTQDNIESTLKKDFKEFNEKEKENQK